MSYEIQRMPKTGIAEAEAGSKQEVFKQLTKALNELTYSDTGNDVYEVNLSAEGLNTLLYDYIEHLILLQDTENLQIGTVKEMTIEKDKNFNQVLHAKLYMDKQTGISYWPIKRTRSRHTEVDYEKGIGWKAKTKVKFDVRAREAPQTDDFGYSR